MAEKLAIAVPSQSEAGSFDFVRLSPHFGQDNSSLFSSTARWHVVSRWGWGFQEHRETDYILFTTKLPEPEHPELIPTSVQVPVMMLFCTVPCRVRVLPPGFPDLIVS